MPYFACNASQKGKWHDAQRPCSGGLSANLHQTPWAMAAAHASPPCHEGMPSASSAKRSSPGSVSRRSYARLSPAARRGTAHGTPPPSHYHPPCYIYSHLFLQYAITYHASFGPSAAMQTCTSHVHYRCSHAWLYSAYWSSSMLGHAFVAGGSQAYSLHMRQAAGTLPPCVCISGGPAYLC